MKKIIVILSTIILLLGTADVLVLGASAAYNTDTPYTNEIEADAVMINGGFIRKIAGLFHKHEYTYELVDATCTEDGYFIGICKCGEQRMERGSSATGHHFEAIAVEATCTESGHVEYSCECGEHYSEVTTPAIGHTYTNTVIAPTCNEMGYITYSCFCGETYKADYIDATGHVKTSVITVTSPTCTTSGKSQEVCDKCGAVINEFKISATGHSFGSWQTTKAATPDRNGEDVRTCACGKKETKTTTFAMAGKNSIYIQSAGINVKYAVTDLSQSAVDNNNVICNYSRLGSNDPMVLGHNYNSLGKIYNTTIGSYIYFSQNGVISKYKVIVSEAATLINGGTDLKGISTGATLLETTGTSRIHMYTCYNHPAYGNIRWMVIAEKVS